MRNAHTHTHMFTCKNTHSHAHENTGLYKTRLQPTMRPSRGEIIRKVTSPKTAAESRRVHSSCLSVNCFETDTRVCVRAFRLRLVCCAMCWSSRITNNNNHNMYVRPSVTCVRTALSACVHYVLFTYNGCTTLFSQPRCARRECILRINILGIVCAFADARMFG